MTLVYFCACLLYLFVETNWTSVCLIWLSFEIAYWDILHSWMLYGWHSSTSSHDANFLSYTQLMKELFSRKVFITFPKNLWHRKYILYLMYLLENNSLVTIKLIKHKRSNINLTIKIIPMIIPMMFVETCSFDYWSIETVNYYFWHLGNYLPQCLSNIQLFLCWPWNSLNNKHTWLGICFVLLLWTCTKFTPGQKMYALMP